MTMPGREPERSKRIFAVALRWFTRGTVHTMCYYLISVAVVVRKGTERLSDLHQKNSVSVILHIFCFGI